MSNRKLLVLTGVFFALVAFVFLYERHQPSSEERAKARKKLIDFKAEDVTALAIARADLPPVAVKKDAAGRWRLAGEPGGPADKVAIDALVGDLSRLELLGEPTTSYDAKDLGLDTPRAAAVLTFKDGSQKNVRFGKEIPGTDATAAVEGNRFGAVKFAPISSLTKPVDDFRSKQLVDALVSEITRLTVTKGQAKVVVARAENPDKSLGPWRLEAPVKDLASQTFVDQLLSDLTSARISEFASLPAAELQRVGLVPPVVSVVLNKGTEAVADVAFGAAKADAAGKVYASADGTVVVVDDRVMEDLNKELSAYREVRVCPVDSWAAQRVAFEEKGVRTGAERVDNEWRSGGRPVGASLAEDLVDKLSRAEAKRFVTKKDYAAAGIPVAAKGKKVEPLAVFEVTPEKATEPTRATFFPAAPLAGVPAVAVEVAGRSEAMLVDRSVLQELQGLAARLKAASLGQPTPAAGPTKPAPAPTAAPAGSVAVPTAAPAKR